MVPFDAEISENIIDQNSDDFLNDLQNEDVTSFTAADEPPLMDSDKPNQDDESQFENTPDDERQDTGQDKLADTVSELIITMFDITHNSLMRFIADEVDGSKFAVSQADKRKLKGSLAKVLESKTMKISPEMLLLITAVIVYAPSTIAAFQIRSVKQRAQKAAEKANADREARAAASRPSPAGPVTATVESLPVYKAKGGRPAGTTKEVLELRKQLEKKPKRKK